MSLPPRYATRARFVSLRHIYCLLSAMLLCQSWSHAQSGPQPPCGLPPVPPYPALNQPATVKEWSRSELRRDWIPPACIGWEGTGFTSLVTITARFRTTSDAEGLLRHIGAISQLAGLSYWSTSHQQWRTLIDEAHALTGFQPAQGREDFRPEEMTEGKFLHYEQTDNLSGKAIYRMHIITATADRIVYDMENVSTMHYLFLTVFHPREMQSIYFLDRESDGVWRFYGMARTGINASRLIAGNGSSAINRTVAFYRYLVGIPATQEPPAAR